MQGKNKVLFNRYLHHSLTQALRQKRSCLVLGPRQTGKTTLVKEILAGAKTLVEYPLQNPATRRSLESDPGKIIREAHAAGRRPTIFVDEAQKVPDIFDSAQYLIDEGRALFMFTGSSARKLRRGGANLLPGRVRHFYLDPLLWGELGYLRGGRLKSLAIKNINSESAYNFSDSLVYGALPAVAKLPANQRADLLRDPVALRFQRLDLGQEFAAPLVQGQRLVDFGFVTGAARSQALSDDLRLFAD